MSLQFIRYSAYRLALRNRAQSVPYTISLKKKTPTLNGILPVFSIAGADIRNLTGYSTQLDHQAFPAYNHSFFPFSTPEFYVFPPSSASLNSLLAQFCRGSAKLGKGKVPQSGECAREQGSPVDSLKRTEVIRRTFW